MATTVTGKLNKPANQFQAGDSVGFGLRIGVKYRDPKTKEDGWTNYSAVVFAKAPGQVQFYQQALIEGAIVEITCDQLKLDSFDGQNGTTLTAEMLNARIGYVYKPEGAAVQQSYGQQPQYQQQNNFQQPAPPPQGQPQGAYQQQAPSFNDDIPF